MNNQLSKRKRYIYGLAALLAFLYCYLLFYDFPFGQEVNQSFWKRLLDAGHFPFFALLAFCWGHYSAKQGTYDVFRRILTLLCIAVVTELIQPYFGRSESVNDAVSGSMGIIWGAGVAYVYSRKKGLLCYWGVSIVALLGFLCYVLRPAYLELQGIVWREEHLPLLAEFETPTELRLWRAGKDGLAKGTKLELSEKVSKQGRLGLNVSNAEGGNLTFAYDAGDYDWSSYQNLVLNFYTGEPRVVHLRIDDNLDCQEYGDRFDRALNLNKGWNEITLSLADIAHGPKNRPLNIKGVRRLLFFTNDGDVFDLGLDNIFLH